MMTVGKKQMSIFKKSKIWKNYLKMRKKNLRSMSWKLRINRKTLKSNFRTKKMTLII